jgi:hypothetical protein
MDWLSKVQVDRKDDANSQLQLQAWEYSIGDRHARYVHALSNDFPSNVSHLDGAIVHFSESDLDTHLNRSKKVKGTGYKKYFRIDGNIEIAHAHNIVKRFFQSDLYSEAFEVESLI